MQHLGYVRRVWFCHQEEFGPRQRLRSKQQTYVGAAGAALMAAVWHATRVEGSSASPGPVPVGWKQGLGGRSSRGQEQQGAGSAAHVLACSAGQTCRPRAALCRCIRAPAIAATRWRSSSACGVGTGVGTGGQGYCLVQARACQASCRPQASAPYASQSQAVVQVDLGYVCEVLRDDEKGQHSTTRRGPLACRGSPRNWAQSAQAMRTLL